VVEEAQRGLAELKLASLAQYPKTFSHDRECSNDQGHFVDLLAAACYLCQQVVVFHLEPHVHLLKQDQLEQSVHLFPGHLDLPALLWDRKVEFLLSQGEEAA
jgi:hypothetical protein